MNVLVMGGSGFIGSHVADALTGAGYSVTVFDLRPSDYLRENQIFTQGNMLDRAQVADAVAGHDIVYNLAGIPHLDVGLHDPVGTVEQNILGTVISLEASREAGIQRYIYASSVYVYSVGGSFYRCSKQAAELYVEEYERLHGLDFTILRYGSVYGPRADDYNYVRVLLKQALLERRIISHGAGENDVREYIHVRDAASSSVSILSEEFKNERVILSGHHPMRRKDLYRMITEIIGQDINIETHPDHREDEIQSNPWHYSVTPYNFQPKSAKKLVNNPHLDMGQGLLECLEEIHNGENTSIEEVNV